MENHKIVIPKSGHSTVAYGRLIVTYSVQGSHTQWTNCKITAT